MVQDRTIEGTRRQGMSLAAGIGAGAVAARGRVDVRPLSIAGSVLSRARRARTRESSRAGARAEWPVARALPALHGNEGTSGCAILSPPCGG